MRKYSDCTPCPVGAAFNPTRTHRVSFASDVRDWDWHGRGTGTMNFTIGNDDTEDVTFTKELTHTLKNSKPRRRPTAGAGFPRESAFNPALDIWSELGREEAQASMQARRAHEIQSSIAGGAASASGRVLAHPQRARRSSAVSGKLPARAVRHDMTAVAEDERRQQPFDSRDSISAAEPKRSRRLSSLLEAQPATLGAQCLPTVDEMSRPAPQARRRDVQLRKDARRRTIFIPSDDTTIVTIHPGQYRQKRRGKSPGLALDLGAVSEDEPENASVFSTAEADVSVRPRSPRPSLAGKPKRAALQQSKQGEANVNQVRDAVGQGGGKENVPPGMKFEKQKSLRLGVKSGPTDIVIHFDDNVPLTKNHFQRKSEAPRDLRNQSVGHRASTTTKKRAGSESLAPVSPAKTTKMRHPTLPANNRSETALGGNRSSQPIRMQSSCSPPAHSKTKTLADLKLASYKASTRTMGKLPLYYPVLPEDLCKAELYEDDWLRHQEVALGQLLNHLLDASRGSGCQPERTSHQPRRRLLALYQSDEFVLAHKRLKASLEFGALAIPRDMIAQVSRLGSDVGLRRRFVSLWVDSYNLAALRAALEVVVGRQVVLPNRLSDSLEGQTEEERATKKLRRGLERFIEMFLIRHEDAKQGTGVAAASIGSIARNLSHSQSCQLSPASSWRRTMLRSLMLVLLLDRAKSAAHVSERLFQRASERKSSASVIQALASMLFPSLGDVTRPLAHLGYRVAHVQYPLEEFEYSIGNLAVDLRDGILLARIVEMLLYSSRSLGELGSDNTMTVSLPSGEMLQSMLHADEKQSWPLSQHLKLPCISRSQRLFNVQISLSALQCSRRSAGHALEGISADDIVDGHREKTLCLLWNLVGKFGLDSLVDWQGLKAETDRIRKACASMHDSDAECSDDEPSRFCRNGDEGRDGDPEELLYAWAKSIGQLNGLRVRNLTTSFSDGKVFEAVVDQYREYLAGFGSEATKSTIISTSTPRLSIASKLREIGCSASFVSLFTPSSASGSAAVGSASIPSKSFVVMTLAYLASRLLPQTAAHRAATAIQRWYRLRIARRNVLRRVQLMRVAADCATVVNTRARVVNAACVLQRAWRAVIEKRLERLVRDVVGLQSRIRGRAARLAATGKSGRRGNGW